MTDNIKDIVDKIIQDDDLIINIPLSDLIWTIVVFSFSMRNIEDELFKRYPFRPLSLSKEEEANLSRDKEYCACRRDELARLIGQYSDFDTQRIWDEVDKIFKDYRKQENL